MWGLAAFYGSRAYNDTDLLIIAEDVWNTVQMFVVTAADAAAGTQKTKTGRFNVHCIPNSDGASRLTNNHDVDGDPVSRHRY